MQENHNIDFPVSLSVEICGVAEAWSRGMPWHQICSTTSMDQGDLHRVFKKTSDLLREISGLPGLHPIIAANSYAAAASFGRYPISNHEYDPVNGGFETLDNYSGDTAEVGNLTSLEEGIVDTVDKATSHVERTEETTTTEELFQDGRIYLDSLAEKFLIGGATNSDELDEYMQKILAQSMKRRFTYNLKGNYVRRRKTDKKVANYNKHK